MRDKTTPARDVEDPVSDHSIRFTFNICQTAKPQSLLLQLSHTIIVNVSGKTAVIGQSVSETGQMVSLKSKYLTSDQMKLSKIQLFDNGNFSNKTFVWSVTC